MTRILAAIDASAYAASVIDLTAWAARRLNAGVEVLHVIQRTDAAAAGQDLSGAIGLGAKSELLEELTRIDEAEARLAVARGRLLLDNARERLGAAGIRAVSLLPRHGGIIETVVEREAEADLVVIGKRGASSAFATEHIGSKVERVVRASRKSVLVASREIGSIEGLVIAYDASAPARRAIEKVAASPLFRDLPVHIVMAGAENDRHGAELAEAASLLRAAGFAVDAALRAGKADAVIGEAVAERPGYMLAMGAYGHAPLRTLIVGSTTTAMVRTVRRPVLLVR